MVVSDTVRPLLPTARLALKASLNPGGIGSGMTLNGLVTIFEPAFRGLVP